MRNRIGLILAALSLILGVYLSTVLGQAPSQGIEQQIRSQYLVTRVGANGTVVGQAGSILVIQGDGLTAIPASYGVYWYSKFKNGGRVTSSGIQHGGSVAASERRFFQVGEKAYLINMEFNPTEIVFYVQSCGACEVSTASAPDPNSVPYRARLAIEFTKGFLITGDLKQIRDTIGQVFGIETGQSIERTLTRDPTSAGVSPAPVRPLRFPATYVSVQTPTDQLRLNADNSFSLQEAGQIYHGTFLASGNTVEISVADTNTRTTMTINGSNLTDPSGQTWTLREQSVPSAPREDALVNADIIKMTAVGIDDATILAKIGSSKCRFDVSTDALIELKRSGISAAVLKAMVGTVSAQPGTSPVASADSTSTLPSSARPSSKTDDVAHQPSEQAASLSQKLETQISSPPAFEARAGYLGYWSNSLSEHRSIRQVVITEQQDKVLVNAFGVCEQPSFLGRECEWGTVEARTVSDALIAVWPDQFKSRRLVLSLGQDKLTIVNMSHFPRHPRDNVNESCLLDRSVDREPGLSLLPPPVLLSPLRGKTFDIYPRTTVMTWQPVSEAVGYAVEWAFFGNSWSDAAVHRTSKTTFTLNFVGAQPGRWRVSAINKNGREGQWSEWWEFKYLR